MYCIVKLYTDCLIQSPAKFYDEDAVHFDYNFLAGSICQESFLLKDNHLAFGFNFQGNESSFDNKSKILYKIFDMALV